MDRPITIEKRIFEDGLKNVNVLRFAMLKIGFCNAVCSFGFSDAQLKYKVIKDDTHDKHRKILSVRFDTLFKDGIKLLRDLENSDRKFETLKSYEKSAIRFLDDFFKNVDHYEERLKKVFGRNPVSETDITIALAEHLLGRLAPGDTYIINHKVKGKGPCKCGCGVLPEFGNTGIGHEAVWHGHIDIIISSHHGLPSSDIAVRTVGKYELDEAANEEEPDELANEEEAETSTPQKKRRREGDLEETKKSPGGKSVTEVKQSSSHGAIQQTLAQAIVFSLLQKQKHPNFKNFLFPNILISPQKIQIVMYDAEYDVLLCSNIIKLFDADGLIPETLVILWMVLHYQMFCTGLPPMLHEYRSYFKKLSEEKWDIYSKSLKGGVSSFPMIEEEVDFNTDLWYAKEIC